MRRGRSIVFNLKVRNFDTKEAEIITTSVSIDETIADLFCIKNNNILCDSVGEKFLRQWCQSKADEFKMFNAGLSAHLREKILFELVIPDVVEKYEKQIYAD